MNKTNNYAVTSADVAESLQRSASVLKLNGVSLSQSIGMVMGGGEILQDPSKMGNSLKTMVNKLNGVTYSMKEGEVQTNKTASALEKLAGIKVVDYQKNEVKDAFTVFDELASKWENLGEIQRNGIAEALGGAHHINTLSALMSNWQQVLKYVDEYNQGLTEDSAKNEKQYSPYVQKCA